MDSEIIIKPKYTLRDYLNFLFKNKLNTIGFKATIFIAIIMLLVDVLYLFNLIDKSIFSNGLPTFNIVFPIVVLIIFPLFIYFITKKSFENNFRLKEDFSIIFNKYGIQEKGETFDVKTPWKEIKTLRETKKIFLINYKNKVSTFYPKRFFSKEQIINFKELIRSLDIKKKLI